MQRFARDNFLTRIGGCVLSFLIVDVNGLLGAGGDIYNHQVRKEIAVSSLAKLTRNVDLHAEAERP